MQATLGINNCFAVKRWPRAADWAPVVADELGLDVVQHSLDLVDFAANDHELAEDAESVRTAAAAAGLDVHSTFTGLTAYSSNLLLHPDRAWRDRAEAWYRRVISYTALAGASATGGHIGAYSVPDWTYRSRRDELQLGLAERMDRLSADASAAGLASFYVENLASNREPSTMADIQALLRPGDPEHASIELCLDIGHQCVPGAVGPELDPYAWLATLGPRAGLIHLQQSAADGDHHWPFTEARNRDGRIDASRVLDTLAEAGAERVTLILEVIPPFEQSDDSVVADLVESVGYWRQAIASRSLARAT